MKICFAGARLGLLAAGFATGGWLPATGVLAQDYPNKPIRLIVPFGAGGGSDYVGRLVGLKLTQQMGQTVVDGFSGRTTLASCICRIFRPESSVFRL